MSSVESFKRRQRNHLNRVEGLASVAAGDSVVNGTFFVNNIGEGIKAVLFPVKFFHLPQIKLSYEAKRAKPRFSSAAPYTMRLICDQPSAPAHITQGSTVT